MLVGDQFLLIFHCDASKNYLLLGNSNFVHYVSVIMEFIELKSRSVLLSGYTTMEFMILININK